MTEYAQIYFGNVMHQRLHPVQYRFVYRVFSLLLNIDQLDAAARQSRLFSYNRFNVFSFHDRDHGPRDGSKLRPWIEGVLSTEGIDLEGGTVDLLCFPRVFGYVFNPLSLWFCRHRDGRLRAVLCEVRNTFGEKHGYLLHERGRPMTWPVCMERSKRFHVSPFISMDADYHFRISEPNERLRVIIREYQGNEPMLVAAQTGQREPLGTGTLLRALITMPFMTVKVMAMIHWQALKIWLQGARFHKKPPPPQEEVS